MIRSPTDIPVREVVIVIDPEPTETNYDSVFTYTFFLQLFNHKFYLTAIHGAILAPVYNVWSNYYQQVLSAEEGVVMPRSALTFIITTLLSLVEIKSQGQPGFPFQSHPHTTMVAVTSLLVYGLASAAELGASASGPDHTSVCAINARLGRIGSLCILVVSLICLLYF